MTTSLFGQHLRNLRLASGRSPEEAAAFFKLEHSDYMEIEWGLALPKKAPLREVFIPTVIAFETKCYSGEPCGGCGQMTVTEDTRRCVSCGHSNLR